MENYLGVKLIKAEPCFRDQFAGAENKSDLSKLSGGIDVDGYRVVDESGYVSWSPKDVFEEAYRKTTGLTFGLAIEAMKLGKKVTRNGWNSKGMFLWLKPEVLLIESMLSDPKLKELCKENKGVLLGLGTICMYTHDSSGRKAILTGWSGSQSDMLSEDWSIVE